MYYITLDLEWNQAYRQQLLSVQKSLSQRLLGEVVQIGAVKLDESLRPCGSFQIIVRPRFFRKIHRHVRELTGITQEKMDRGAYLTDAGERFRKWCGEDFAFLTWGPDDVPMLADNFRANKMDCSWLLDTYDLQPMFSRQTDGLPKQRSLEYAMEYFGIPQNLPPHDALNDAYFTALVAARLDVARGVRECSVKREADMQTEEFGNADAGDEGYVAIDDVLRDSRVLHPACPVCGGVLAQKERTLHSRGQKYSMIFECERDGSIMQVVRLHRNFDETWRVKRTANRATAEEIEDYRLKLEESVIRRKTGMRRNRPAMKKKPYREDTAGETERAPEPLPLA